MPHTAPMAAPTVVAVLAEPSVSPLTIAAPAPGATVRIAGPAMAMASPVVVVLAVPVTSRAIVLLVVVARGTKPVVWVVLGLADSTEIDFISAEAVMVNLPARVIAIAVALVANGVAVVVVAAVVDSKVVIAVAVVCTAAVFAFSVATVAVDAASVLFVVAAADNDDVSAFSAVRCLVVPATATVVADGTMATLVEGAVEAVLDATPEVTAAMVLEWSTQSTVPCQQILPMPTYG